MRRRGFTMVELAIVITLLGILVPLIFMLFHVGAADFQKANATLEAADQLRDLSEELRLDLRTGTLAEAGLRIDGEGGCFPVTYRLAETTLVREAPAACGGSRGLVRHVRTLERRGPLLTLQLAQLPEDLPLTVVLPLAVAR